MINEFTLMDSRDFYGYTVYEDGTILNSKNRIMKPSVAKCGRKEIKLTIDLRKRKCFIISRLVYCLFNNLDYFTLDKDLCIVAKDGDNGNTHISNLEMKHRRDLIQGENHKNVNVLTKDDVDKIRLLYSQNGKRPVNQVDLTDDYYSYRRLGKMFGVTHTHIKKIIDGEIWNPDEYKL